MPTLNNGESVTIELVPEQITITPDLTTISIETGGQQGPQGIPGDGKITVTASAALSAGRLVTVDENGAAYYDPSDTALYGKAVGITKHAAAAAALIDVVAAGKVDLVGAGYTPGTKFWAGPNGTLVSTAPTSGLIVPVGYAIDADTLFVQIESYLEC
jgi:hypothetical protein